METQAYNPPVEKRGKRKCSNRGGGGTRIGIILVIIGILLLLKTMGIEFPFWVFQWYSLLILIGLLIGIGSAFRDKGGLIMMAVGAVFLLRDVYSDTPYREYAIPVVVILAGIFFMISNRRRRQTSEQQDGFTSGMTDEAVEMHKSDVIDVAAVFGGVKRLVVTKNFRGGEAVAVFGGVELNLIQSDIQHPIELETVAVFGGIKLIIPSNWNVRSEAVAIFGGVEDKRDPNVIPDPNKTIVLKGSTIFGGIEIKSFA
jgi:predicted membrane protein